MSDEATTPGTSDGGSRWILLLSTLLAVFAGGGAFFYFSSENASRFLLELREGHIVVRKGIFFPTGAIDYDGGATYAPIEVPPGVAAPAGPFADLVAVDEALYGLLLELTRGAIESGEAARLQNARKLTARALKLPSVTDDQVDDILRYKGDLAIAEGQLALLEVRDLLARARERMGRAVTRGTLVYKDPQGWVAWIDRTLARVAQAEGARTPPANDCPASVAAPSPPVAPASVAPPAAPSTPAPSEVPAVDVPPPPLPGEPPPAEALSSATPPAEPPSAATGSVPPGPPAGAPLVPAPVVPAAPPPPPAAAPPEAPPPGGAPPALPQGSDPGTGLLFGNP